MKKSVSFLNFLFLVILVHHHYQWSAVAETIGIRRVVRQSENNFDLSQKLTEALKKIRLLANDRVKADVDQIQAALDSGALQQTLDQVKAELKDDTFFDFKKVIGLIQEKAPPELQEAVSRIIQEGQTAMDKVKSHLHDLKGKFDEKLKGLEGPPAPPSLP